MNFAKNLVIISTCLININFAYGQNQQETNKDNNSKKNDIKVTPWKYQRNPNEFAPKNIKQIPTLGNIPPYKGKDMKVDIAIQFPNAKGGCVTDYSFQTSDDPDKVFNWYRGILSGQNWTMHIAPNNFSGKVPKTGATIICRSQNQSCTVNVLTLPNKKCQVKVLYRQNN